MTTPAPELPDAAQAHSPDARRAMALRFLAHAEDELAKGHRLQASEKAWAAVAQQLKAIAAQRGWNHKGHRLLYDIALYLDREYPGLNLRLSVAGADHHGHQNFYENEAGEEIIDDLLNDVGRLVDDLEDLRHRPPQSYTITSEDEDKRVRAAVRRLTGTEYALPVTRVGFINYDRLREDQRKWGAPPPSPEENGEEDTGGNPTPPPGPPLGGAPGGALPTPTSTGNGALDGKTIAPPPQPMPPPQASASLKPPRFQLTRPRFTINFVSVGEMPRAKPSKPKPTSTTKKRGRRSHPWLSRKEMR